MQWGGASARTCNNPTEPFMSSPSPLTLHVSGMNCASCSARVERAAASVPGITGAEVNLALGSLRVRGTAAPQALAATLAEAGYPVAQEETRLSVSGMTCASCVGRVERVFSGQPGVLAASVNLATETATIRHLAIAGLPDRLADAVTDAGYPARPIGDDTRARQEAARAGESAALARRLTLAAALTLPVFVLEMGGHMVPAFHHWVHTTIGMWESWVLQFVLTTLVLFGPGLMFFRHGIPALLRGAPDMNSLVAVGTLAAWGFSTVATFAPALLPQGSAAVYFEAAAVIVTLILLGRWLEARAKGRTGAAIARLLGLQAKSARVERDGVVRDTPIDRIEPGDIIHVRPGERIAVDGTVTEGRSYVDESMISGEPVPAAKEPGAAVTGGTVNGTGALTFRATRVGADTMLAQIIRLVEEAQGAKLPIQALVDRVTLYFVPAVMVLALVTLAIWLAVGPDPRLGHALVAAVAVLIIACPCAMGLATPTSIMVGTGRAAEMGVLFRRGDALQALQGVGVVAFDKTGTLTEGRPELVALEPAPGFDADTVLRLVAAVESRAEHPIAQAIVREAYTRGLDLPQPQDFDTITGFGARARVDGHEVLVGAARLFAREGIDLGALTHTAEARAARGQTPLFAAIDGKAAALIAVADRIKPSTPGAIQALHAMGLKVAMITGDAKGTAQAIATELGIDIVEAEVLPAGKVAALEALRAGGARLAFVGDGINDAPALAAADIGIAIGTGTDVAIESADVVLISGDLRGVVNALDVSRRTIRNIRQNLFWAFAYNTALIPVAAGVLYPAFGLTLSPVLAAGAMALSSVFVISNALRLRRLRPVMAEGHAPAVATTPAREITP